MTGPTAPQANMQVTGALAPYVSVVIPVRNGADTIADQLEALAAQEYDGPWEIVVSDNGSTDGTRTTVESMQSRMRTPPLRVVTTDDGVGINVSRNGGVRRARGELILICDADDVVQPGWVAAHVETLRKVDISGGPVDEAALNVEDVAAFNAAKYPDHLPVCGRFLPYAVGCNFGFRRRVWESINGFNDAWQRGSTETEFCWRAQLAGFSIGWTPGAVVAYRHGTSIRSEVKRRYRAARAMPRLFAEFRVHGMPPQRLGPAFRAWLWLIYRAAWAGLDRSWRMKWLQVAAWRAGLIVGSIRYRVVYL